MFYFYLILSAIGDFFITYFGRLVDSIGDFWKPLLIYPALFITFVLLHLLSFILYSLTADSKKEVTSIDNSYRKFMIVSLRLFFHLARIHIHVTGKNIIPDDGKYLFVCNHLSVYDPMIEIVEFADKRLSFVSKKENLTVKFAGKYMIKAGCVGLDREDNRQAVKAIGKAAQQISDGMCAMGIYPEGWVNKSDDVLLPFRNGAFKIAKKAKVPIVIATVRNTESIKKNIPFHSTDAYVDVIKILPYDEIAELKTVEIGEKVYEIMRENLTKVQ